MSDFTKHYSNGEITIVWKAELCQHSATCFRNLPQVFDPRIKPWIRPENAENEAIIQVVHRCPSGALSMLDQGSASEPPPAA